MDEEEKNKKQGENEEEQLLTDQKDKVEEAVGQGVTMGLGFFKGKAKQAAGALTKKAIAAIASFISSFSGFIIIALIVIIFVVSLLDIVANIFDFGPRDSTSIGNSQINEMFQINENGITMKNPDEMIKNVKKNLEEAGFRLESLGLGNEEQAKAYLFKFYQASMATQIPYIPTSEVKGIIRVKRTNTTVQEARELTWITHEKFAQMLEAKDASLQNYYALDENWNLCVSTTTTRTAENKTEQTITEVKIPYQTVVSQYSVPFRYLMIMLQVTQNPEYIRYMCDMFIEGKQIDFTIFDSIQTTTDVHTYTYYTKVREKVEHTSYAPEDTEHKNPHTTYTMKEKVSSSPKTETTTTTTVTNTITANITYANTWLAEITNEYTNENSTQYPLGEEGQTVELPDEDEPPKNQEGKWKVNQTTTSKSTVTSNTWTQAGTNGKIKEAEFLGLWKNKTGTPQTGATYDPNGKEVEYPLPRSNKKQSPLPKLLTAEDFMFELLERYEDVQSYSDIMKYMLYKYTGKNYGVTSLDIDIFKSKEFVQMSGTYGGRGGLTDFIEWLHQWEGHEGISADGTQYKIGTDGLGHPTVGYGIDIFNGGYEQTFIAAGYPTTVGSYVDKEFVDELERKEIEECINYIKSQTSQLNLKEYQIYALVSRAYNCGKSGALRVRNGKNFVQAYTAYWNEETDNRFGESTVNYAHPLYTTYMNKPDTSDGVYVEGLENRRKAEWTLFTTGYYDRTGKFYQEGNSGFLGVAESLWKEIATSGRYTAYGGASIPVKGPTIDCSAYVCWVLYEYGLTEFKGGQASTDVFYATNWNQRYGWEEILVASGQSPIDILQPGDMFVRYEGHGKGQTHHILIVAYIENGKLYAYDCGAASNWLNSNGEAINQSYFLTKKGPGKIIRIKESSTQNSQSN